MQFNVAQLLKEVTGAVRRYDVNSQILSQLDEDVNLVSSLIGTVKFLRTGEDILVTGSLTGTVKKSCGRCLTKFEGPVSIELEEQFHPTIDVNTGTMLPSPEEVDNANRIDTQHILDLLEVVRQGFLLENESVRYCRANCKGLCPQCGQDRNANPCNCEDETMDLRWAGLQALKKSINTEQ